MVNSKVIEVIENIAKSLGFASFDIESPELFQKGEGFLSEQYGVTVKDKNSDKSVNLIVKQALKSNTAREIAPVRSVFDNEIFFYASILPEFNKFSPDCQDLVPVCYAQCSDDNNEFLIMEDLRDKNFKNPVKSEFLNGDQLKFVLKRYAKFHAFSFALNEKNPEFVKKSLRSNVDALKELFDHDWVIQLNEQTINLLTDVFDKASDKEILEKLIKYYKGNVKEILEKCMDNTSDGFMAFLHGDCWTNNLMIKTDEKGDLVDLRMLDFQFQRIGSIVCDLSYFLYSGTRKQELDRLDEHLKVYHDSLTENMLKLKCDPKNIISFQELQRQWNKYAKFGLMLSCIAIAAKIQKTADAKRLDEEFKRNEETINNDSDKVDGFFTYDKEEYKKLVSDIIRHMHEIQAF